MKLSSQLLTLLVCPVTGNNLIYDKEAGLLINKKDKLVYPIIDGIPLLLTSEAKKQ
jgi:uncharacterized protein YbaR (Trm112 family)